MKVWLFIALLMLVCITASTIRRSTESFENEKVLTQKEIENVTSTYIQMKTKNENLKRNLETAQNNVNQLQKELDNIEEIIKKFNGEPAPEEIIYNSADKINMQLTQNKINECEKDKTLIVTDYEQAQKTFEDIKPKIEAIKVEYNGYITKTKELDTSTKKLTEDTNNIYRKINEMKVKLDDIQKRTQNCQIEKQKKLNTLSL